MNTERTNRKQPTGVLLCAALAVLTAITGASYGKTHHHRTVRHHYSPYLADPAYRVYPGYPAHPGYRDYSGYLDPRSGHYDPQFQRNRENFGFSGRDPSRIGGEDPNLHPPGNI